MRLLERFIASAKFLSERPGTEGLLPRYQRAFHRYEVSALPGKLAAWKSKIPPEMVASIQDEIDALLQHLDSVSNELLQKEIVDSKSQLDKSSIDKSVGKLASEYDIINWSTLREARF